jgi:regulatory protein
MSSREDWINKAYSRLAAYCAKAERSPRQIRDKLKNYQLANDELALILKKLISENYLNEKRFAQSFAIDKLKFNKWGKIRISRELNAHGISDEIIGTVFEYIDEEVYADILRKVINYKWKQTTNEKELYIRKNKVIKYVLQKGFSFDEVSSFVDEIMRHQFIKG